MFHILKLLTASSFVFASLWDFTELVMSGLVGLHGDGLLAARWLWNIQRSTASFAWQMCHLPIQTASSHLVEAVGGGDHAGSTVAIYHHQLPLPGDWHCTARARHFCRFYLIPFSGHYSDVLRPLKLSYWSLIWEERKGRGLHLPFLPTEDL